MSAENKKWIKIRSFVYGIIIPSTRYITLKCDCIMCGARTTDLFVPGESSAAVRKVNYVFYYYHYLTKVLALTYNSPAIGSKWFDVVIYRKICIATFYKAAFFLEQNSLAEKFSKLQRLFFEWLSETFTNCKTVSNDNHKFQTVLRLLHKKYCKKNHAMLVFVHF